MKKTVKYNKEIIDTITLCDICKQERKEILYNRIKKCEICNCDVCWNCSEHLDLDSDLLQPNFIGDYPNFICKNCWESGLEIRKEIMKNREEKDNNERILWDRWQECQKKKMKADQ